METARGGPGRDLVILLVSGVVVLAGAATARRGPGPAADDRARAPASVDLPPPLPSGAPPRALQALPADDERAAGCHFVDRGPGDYGEWRRLPLPGTALSGLARALVPAGRAVASDGSFRLLVHFHGAEPVRRQLAPEALDLVIAAVEAEVAAANRLPAAKARSIVLSSWSAGYGAVAQILGRGDARVDAVVLLDSLYAGYVDPRRSLDRARLAPFVGAARAALAGGPAFFLTHTEIATPGYGSTAEVASFLLAELGVSSAPSDEAPGLGAGAYPLRTAFEQGRLWIRGYGGADRDAHCAQLHLLPVVLRDAVLPALR